MTCFKGWLRSILAIVVLCAGVSSPAGAQQTEPGVRISRIDAIRWNGNHATLDLALGVDNPSGVALLLQTLRFRCFLEETAVAAGQSLDAVEIPANGSSDIPVTLEIDAETLLRLAATLGSSRAVGYRIEGVAEVGPASLPVPFSRSGTVALGR